MKDFETKLNECPVCKHKIDRASETMEGGREPKGGDFSVCIYCTAFLRFEDDMTLRKATQADMDELPPEARQTMARVRWARMQQMMNAGQAFAIVDAETREIKEIIDARKAGAHDH